MTINNHHKTVWLALLATLLLVFVPRTYAQEVDDLQAYLDQLAAEQAAKPVMKAPLRAESVEIPVGLTEVDLSKFTSYQNRTKQLTIKASVKFTNGIITATSNYSGGGSLLKVYGGATVVLDATAGVNAGATSSANCLAAVGIYEGSTFYQYGDITAPDNGTGIAIYIDGASDTYVYVSGTTKGSISNKNGGTIKGMEEPFDLQKAIDAVAASSNKGTATNPVEIELPESYELTDVVNVPSGIFVRLKGGKLKVASSLSESADFVIRILGDVQDHGTLFLKNVTIDCNNKAFHYSFFWNRGTLYIEDGVTFQNINAQTGRDGGGFYLNEGSLHIASGTVSVAGNVIKGGGFAYIDGGVLQGSTVVNSNGNWANGVRMGSGPGVTVTGGTLKAIGTVFDSSDNTYGGGANISGGSISGTALFMQGSYYSVRITGGTISVTRLVELTGKMSMGVSTVYVAGNVALNVALNIGVYATSALSKTWVFNCASTDFNKISMMAGGLSLDGAPFEEKQLVVGDGYVLTEADFKKMTFNNVPETLEIYYNAEQHSVNVKEKETFDIEGLKARVTAFGNEVNDLQTNILDLGYVNANNVTGDYYFMRKATTAYTQQLTTANDRIADIASTVSKLIDDYNSLTANYTISTAEEAETFDQKLTALEERLKAAKTTYAATYEDVYKANEAYNALEVNFPDQDQVWSIRPAGLTEELQIGYKSNRGFVLTSAGMMQFEQVEGATFRLKDMDGNYLVSTSSTITTGNKDDATQWVGMSNGEGSYSIFRNEFDIRGNFVCNYYLYNSGITVNSVIGAAPAIPNGGGCSWNIEEGIDDLQAFLNMLAEEEDTGGSDSGLTEKDTLDYVLPDYDPNDPKTPVPTKPYVFPKVPYPIHIIQPGTGCWPIPNPTPGKPRGADFHPIYIPKGSHVIIDDVTFRDIVGGDHVIYVEGVIEINVTITVVIENWQWFIHVGPGGRVIWNPGGGEGRPRIKNEGTFDFAKGNLGYAENWGIWNHTQGTIVEMVNRKTYQFAGGIINLLHNYGTYNHSNGEVVTAKNYQGGTYTMTGGYVRGTSAVSTETVFHNLGTFYFRGGVIGGYGSRLIYHGKGGTLRIDGGHFDFSHVTNYWIEAYDHFYIRGDYDYQPTVPLCLSTQVTIRILYKWIYKWNIVFLGGRPTPRFPLFWADTNDFKLARGHFGYIGWTLPNSRWRWHLDETANTIEPRDEEVEDEDDLQAYLDWLAAHQSDDAASSEEQPQQLDLKGRTISINKPVELPASQHVTFINGTFKPASAWTQSRMFYIPATTSVRLERTVIDFSSSVHYVSGSQTMLRYLFEVFGTLYIGAGTQIKGYYNTAWQVSDNNLKGSIIRIDPQARLYLTGGSLVNVVLCLNSVVNIYVTNTIVNNVYVYVPTSYRKAGFRLMAPWSNYHFTLADLRRIILIGTTDWGVDFGTDGHASLFDLKNMGDVNLDGRVDVADVETAIGIIVGKKSPTVRADMNLDGRVSTADFSGILQKATAK
ncbi:MAG: dockerin type I repeat-containing protein [Prevotella sp.]|nr:dockerin type I repeat-containing protein [Prevotella sp.]MBR0275666.1 dockerin type I repeat-containing protein [Prevotella sp.]